MLQKISKLIEPSLAVLMALLLAHGTFAGTARAQTFTLAALPDTQIYVKSDELNLGFESQTQWIADNAAANNIVFVTQLGDLVSEGGQSVTEGGVVFPNNEAQWARANRAISTLDAANVPWNAAIGNHELNQVDNLSSGYSQRTSNFGPTATGRFDSMTGWGGASPDELSSYQFFTGGSREYMIMHLQFDVPDPAIAWAQGVIDANPGIPTILSTHVFEGNTFGPPNNPYIAGPGRNSQIQIFDKLINNNDQVFMVLSAHVGEERRQTKLNATGRKVFQIAQDFAPRANGGDGWMRLLEFDENNNEIRVKTFTPGVPANPVSRFETDANSQFTLPLDWGVRFDGEPLPPPPPPPETTIIHDYESSGQSSQYTLTQSFGSGGTIEVAGGALTLRTGESNTVAAMLDNGTNFVTPGTSWAIDVLDEGNSFMMVSTTPAQPDGTDSFGFRLRRDGGAGIRVQEYTGGTANLTSVAANPSGPITFWIDRIDQTKFEFYYDQGPETGRVLIGQSTLLEAANIDNLFVGMQAFGGNDSIRFDNLRASESTLPVPGTAAIEFSWSAFDELSKIDTTGTLVEAVNINGNAVTLNTVDFVTGSTGSFFDNANLFDTNFTSAAGSVSIELLTGGERTAGASDPPTRGIATFSELTVGNEYLFQIMSLEDRTGAPLPDRELAIADSEPALRGDYDLDGIDFSNAQGAIITGRFTADATEQTIYMAVFQGSAGTAENGVFVQAFQLRDITAETVGLDGDINGDDTVDREDVALFVAAYGTTANGDYDGDGATGLTDLAATQRNFGQSLSANSSTAVPEPSALILCLMATIGWAFLPYNRSRFHLNRRR